MKSLDPAAKSYLDRWQASAQPDWDDVLRRARHRKGRRLGRGAAVPVTVLTLLGLLVTVPAFGIGDRLTALVKGGKRPGLELKTTLTLADGTRIGTFTVRTSRLFITVAGKRTQVVPHVFTPRGKLFVGTVPVRWTLVLTTGEASEAGLEQVDRSGRRHVVLRLCKPCGAKTVGRGQLRRNAVGGLFGGHTRVVVRTSTGVASGVLRLRLPRG